MQIVSPEASAPANLFHSSEAAVTSPIDTTTPLPSPDRDPWLPGKFEKMLEAHGIGFKLAKPPQSDPPAIETPSRPALFGERSLRLSQSFSGPVGYLANRWNLSSSFSSSTFSLSQGDEPEKPESFTPSTCSPVASAPVLPPPSVHRQFRLSLSLEGKAELKQGASPSPERPQSPRPHDLVPSIPPLVQNRRPSLHRSHSAVTLPPISALTRSLSGATRRARGRSRDVHAWEFACDTQQPAEDELTAQAQHESNGSAIAAISLLRSTSNTTSSVLQPKRNASKPPPQRANKRPKLGRATSSVARMQTAAPAPARIHIDKIVEYDVADAGGKSKKLKVSTLLAASGNDSDKENWSPDEDGDKRPSLGQRPPQNRRPVPGAAQPRRGLGKVLASEDGPRPALLGSSGRANTAPLLARGKKGAAAGAVLIFEDGEDDVQNDDGEVTRFMKGIGNVSPSKEAAAGLLSLASGNWR
jgi:hypothetical protein